MDAHFGESLTAVRAINEIYGVQAEDFPTELGTSVPMRMSS